MDIERDFYIFPQVFFSIASLTFSFTGLSTYYSQDGVQSTMSINTKILKTVLVYSKPIQHSRKEIFFTTGAIRESLME